MHPVRFIARDGKGAKIKSSQYIIHAPAPWKRRILAPRRPPCYGAVMGRFHSRSHASRRAGPIPPRKMNARLIRPDGAAPVGRPPLRVSPAPRQQSGTALGRRRRRRPSRIADDILMFHLGCLIALGLYAGVRALL